MKTRSLVFVCVGAAVLVAAGLVGGVFYGRHMEGFAKVKASKPAPKPAPKPQFVSMGPLVVSLSGQPPGGLISRRSAYLQVGFQFRSIKAGAIPAFKAVEPAIRGKIMNLLLDEPLGVLHDPTKRHQMTQAVLAAVNLVVSHDDAGLGVRPFDRVYLTNFIAQPN